MDRHLAPAQQPVQIDRHQRGRKNGGQGAAGAWRGPCGEEIFPGFQGSLPLRGGKQLFLGELSLDGSLRHSAGILAMVMLAAYAGIALLLLALM